MKICNLNGALSSSFIDKRSLENPILPLLLFWTQEKLEIETADDQQKAEMTLLILLFLDDDCKK